jgi:hypothetical protein
MLDSQIKMSTSPYQQLYDLIVDENHQLRKLHDIIDYSFVHEELRHTYSENMGRKAVEPIVLFKYLVQFLFEQAIAPSTDRAIIIYLCGLHKSVSYILLIK